MAETAFESLSAVFEVTRGTPVTPPDHLLPLKGTITPRDTKFRPDDHMGGLAEIYRSEVVRQWCELEGEGGLDIWSAPFLFNMIIGPLAAGVTAGGWVSGITGLTGGTGYTNAPTIAFAASPAGGRTAKGHALVAGGVVTAIVVDDPGFGYTVAPAITITPVGGGSGASATAQIAPQATLAKYWDFARVINADTIKTSTFYWGDPNQRMFQAAFGVLDSLTFGGDASGTDGSTMSVSGHGNFPTDLAAPAIPAAVLSPLIIPGKMQIWLDSYNDANATTGWGGTEVTGRIVSATHTLQSGATYKFVSTGPAGTITYTRIGRQRTHPETKFVVEFVDQNEWTKYKDHDVVRAKVRHNGPKIETVSSTDFYNFVEVYAYGKLDLDSWGELEGTNRTLEFTIQHEVEPLWNTDLRVGVQSTRSAL